MRTPIAKDVARHMGVLYRIYQPEDFIPTRQMVWPDPQGRFPDDPSYEYHTSQDLNDLDE